MHGSVPVAVCCTVAVDFWLSLALQSCHVFKTTRPYDINAYLHAEGRRGLPLLLRAIDLNLLFAQRGELLLAPLHVRMDGFTRDRKIAHERDDGDTILGRELMVELSGGGRRR